MRVEKTLEVRGQKSQIRLALEVDVPPLGQNVTSQRALAALSWTVNQHGGKGAEQ